MKKLRVFSYLLAIALFAGLLAVSASAASSSLTAPGTVTVGRNFNVTVRINSDAEIGSWDVTLTYNANLLTYVSGADSGGGGAVRFANTNNAGGQYSKSFTVTFKAASVGSAALTLSVNKLSNWTDFSLISCSGASATVRIDPVPEASSVNTLSSLVISPGQLMPAFNANTTEYSVELPFENTSVTVSAKATDGKARVAVGNTALEVGENRIPVTVTAENGAKRVYTLTVTRRESEFAGVTALVQGTEMTFAYDPAAVTPPDGFAATSSTYNEKKVLAYESVGETKILIVDLLEGETDHWYLYDPATESFSAFLPVAQATQTFVLLPLPEDAKPPKGYERARVTFGETEFDAFRPAEKKEASATEPKTTEPPATEPQTGEPAPEKDGVILIVNALDTKGEVGYQYFDPAAGKFFPYFETAAGDEKDDPFGEDPKQQPENRDGLNLTDLKNALVAAGARADRWEIIAIALGILAIGLVIAVILVAVKKKRDNTPDAPFHESPKMRRKIRRQEKKREDQRYDDTLFHD